MSNFITLLREEIKETVRRHTFVKELYENKYDEFYLYCIRITGDMVIAEDLTQDFFAKLMTEGYLRRIKAHNEEMLFSFLRRTLKNLCIDTLRRNSKTIHLEPDAKNQINYNIKTADFINKYDDKIDLKVRLSSLSKANEEIMRLKLTGYTNGEIAFMVGNTKKAVTNRIHRSKNELSVFTDC